MRFRGEIIWIIGASSGIGKALAVQLASEGAKLVLSSRNQAALEDLKDVLEGDHSVLPCDVADAASVADAVLQLQAQQVCPKRVIFMAATYTPGNLHQFDVAQAQQTVNVNFMGAMHLIHAALPMLEASGRGQMVFCSSVASFRGLPGGQPYCATKAALTNLAESLFIETAGRVDIKVIHPGFVRTPLTDKNDFPMPMMIEADEAARCIADGLLARAFEIHFPKGFTWIMKMLHLLPAPLYFWVLKTGMKLSGIRR